MFKTSNRRLSLALFAFTTSVFTPAMLAFNLWGNALVYKMTTNLDCKDYTDGIAQSFTILFLVSTYCIVFIYFIFVLIVKECARRYLLAMDLNPLALRNSFNVPDYNVALIRGRSMADWEDAFAYTVWFLVNGRVGSRADR